MICSVVRSKSFAAAIGAGIWAQGVSSCAAPTNTQSLSKMKLGLCQMGAGADKNVNIAKAKSYLNEAKAKGADVIVLPEVRCLIHSGCDVLQIVFTIVNSLFDGV